jgi:uncharacterized protein
MKYLTAQSLALLLPCLVLFSVPTPPLEAQNFPPKPRSDSFIVDEANVIEAADREAINGLASKLLREEGVALIVVTIRSLFEYGSEAAQGTVESYAQQLFNYWQIGSKGRNYGMLLLVSVGDRKARIELGAGWAHNNDSQTGTIMSSLIIPQFKNGSYSAGVLAGVRGLDAMARGLALPKPEQPKWVLPVMIGLGLLSIGVIFSLFKSGHSGWGWALLAALGMLLFFLFKASNSSSSGGAFGGGFSGGGGASGSW